MTNKAPTASDAAVRKATGKSWGEWITLLKKLKADRLTHQEIASLLSDQHGVSGWWAQGITVEFERAIGRREIGQTCDGDYQASIGKTLAGTIDQALASWRQRAKGLKDFDGVPLGGAATVTKSDKWRYWRVTLADDTKVTIVIGRKGPDKAHLAVNHDKLPDAAAVERWKAYWKDFCRGVRRSES